MQRLLAEGCRILTLVGPGGVGKSRLALEACRHPVAGFPDGVAFVPLETVDEPSDAIRVLADRVGATVEGNQAALDVAIDHLRGQRMLLLIDNFEQILEAGPGLAALLDACPGVSALVTSRRPLRLRGERQITVEPLGLPAAATDVGPPRRCRCGTPVPRCRAVRRTSATGAPRIRGRPEQRRRDSRPGASAGWAPARHRAGRGPGAPSRARTDAGAARTRHRRPHVGRPRLPPAAAHAARDPGMESRPADAIAADSPGPARRFADGATLEAIESVCSGAPVSDLLDDLSVLLDNGLIRADRQRARVNPASCCS